MSKNKPLPKNHPLHHASKELNAAIEFYEKLIEHHVSEFAVFDSIWREFLQKIDRIWNKTQAAMHDHPRWPQLESEINRLRNTDPLLLYLRQARNAEEHSVQSIAADWNANLRLSQVEGNRIHAQWDPWNRSLLPVKNRGITYQPPRDHLGKNIAGATEVGAAEPIIVAELALQFYKDTLNRVVDEVLTKR